jgi:hypothetical protein
VELAGTANAASRRMKKVATGTSMHRIRRWVFFKQLGPWGDIKNAHQNTEWNLDAAVMDLYRHKEDIWKNHRAVNYGRLRFEYTGVTTVEPIHITHKAYGKQLRR